MVLKALENIKRDLDESADWVPVVTVSREDYSSLVALGFASFVKHDLDESADWNNTITVSRKRLIELVGVVEKARKGGN